MHNLDCRVRWSHKRLHKGSHKTVGIKKKSPYQKKPGGTFYCRMIVPIYLPEAAGRTQLTRSFKTDDYNTALKRFGGVLQDLETELQRQLSDPSFRQKVALNSGSALTPDGSDLTASEKAVFPIIRYLVQKCLNRWKMEL